MMNDDDENLGTITDKSDSYIYYLDKWTKIDVNMGNVWEITKEIISYTCSPQVKISQKVLGGYFLTHTVDLFMSRF